MIYVIINLFKFSKDKIAEVLAPIAVKILFFLQWHCKGKKEIVTKSGTALEIR